MDEYRSQPKSIAGSEPPLARLKSYLTELKGILILAREVLVEVKDVVVVLVILLAFIIGAIKYFQHEVAEPEKINAAPTHTQR
jgi:hypothetical protein